jgi:hypothetical protein
LLGKFDIHFFNVDFRTAFLHNINEVLKHNSKKIKMLKNGKIKSVNFMINVAVSFLLSRFVHLCFDNKTTKLLYNILKYLAKEKPGIFL